MTITKAQRWKVLELWTQACKANGWRASDRELRLSTIGGILGRKISTLDEVGRLDECTKVMAELGSMTGVDLRSAQEAVEPDRNHKRNWRWLIRQELLPCLALYPSEANPDRPMGMDGAKGFLATVLEGKTRYRKTDRPESAASLNDFDERTVQQIFWTISARLNDKRKAAGHSGHEMCTLAGVRCKCAACRRKAKSATAAEAVNGLLPGLPGDSQAATAAALASEDPDWTV